MHLVASVEKSVKVIGAMGEKVGTVNSSPSRPSQSTDCIHRQSDTDRHFTDDEVVILSAPVSEWQ
jgi:hypothetical protein